MHLDSKKSKFTCYHKHFASSFIQSPGSLLMISEVLFIDLMANVQYNVRKAFGGFFCSCYPQSESLLSTLALSAKGSKSTMVTR